MILLQTYRPDQVYRTGVIQPYAGVTQYPGAVAQQVATDFAHAFGVGNVAGPRANFLPPGHGGTPPGQTVRMQVGNRVFEFTPRGVAATAFGRVLDRLKAKFAARTPNVQNAPPAYATDGASGAVAMAQQAVNAVPQVAGPVAFLNR
jgi:hypothetical protein